MTNYSDLTRREQVLARLQEAKGDWVDGTDLATAEVGGTEGLKRLRELRLEGHDIRMQRHPDPSRDIFQYRLVIPAQPYGASLMDPSIEAHPGPTYKSEGSFPKADWPPKPEPAEVYEYKQPPGQIRAGSKLGRTEDGTFVVIYDQEPPILEEDAPVDPAPGQQSMDVPKEPWTKFDKMPKTIDMGLHRRCPLCQAYRKPIVEVDAAGHAIKYPQGKNGTLKPRILAYEDFCRDPRKGKGNFPCERCNGFGIVPA